MFRVDRSALAILIKVTAAIQSRAKKKTTDYLESIVGEITGQYKVPFGDAIISTRDTAIGCETCEELFTPMAPHIPMGLNGCEIFTNSSGSHHELRKLQTRISLIQEATRQSGGIYLYANREFPPRRIIGHDCSNSSRN
jgi:predicted amidohydrolase